MAAALVNWNAFDLNLLVVFDTVMQEKNLTRTGQRLGLSQSAISHALARLRHVLNDELFVRSPEGMLPTPRAERMFGPIHQALQDMRVVLEGDEFDPLQASRTFTIAANNYAARAIIPAFVHTWPLWRLLS
jgi:DNA-binding transcriptional LysR family regulator